MKERSQQIIEHLRIGNNELRLAALRSLKNSVIGNKKQKLAYVELGAVQILVDILADPQTDAAVIIQSATTLGSLAATPEGALAVIHHNATPQLLQTLHSPDILVIEAAARSLKAICKSGNAPTHLILAPDSLATLVSILSTTTNESNLAEYSAVIIASCFTNTTIPTLKSLDISPSTIADLLHALVAMLTASPHHSHREAALEAITSVVRAEPSTASVLMQQEPAVLDALMKFLKGWATESPKSRFLACAALTSLCRHNHTNHNRNHIHHSRSRKEGRGEGDDDDTNVEDQGILITDSLSKPPQPMDQDDENSTIISTTSASSINEIRSAVLPVLVRLLGESWLNPDIPAVLADLVEDSVDLQRAAADADVITKLAEFLRRSGSECNGGGGGGGGGVGMATSKTLQRGTLRALAVLCFEQEGLRRQLADCGALPIVAAAMSDDDPEVQAAACYCIRGLTRSTKLLRGYFGEVEVASPLLRLAGSPNLEVAANAAASLANIAIEHSGLRERVLQERGIACLAGHAKSAVPKMRLYGIWGLSSIAFKANSAVKQEIIDALSWEDITGLLGDSSLHWSICEKTLSLLRNLVYNPSSIVANTCAGNATDVSMHPAAAAAAAAATAPFSTSSMLDSSLVDIWQWSKNGQLLDVTADVVRTTERPASLRKHAIYVLVNLASGCEAYKAGIMNSDWPSMLQVLLLDGDEGVREAAVWVCINLSWKRDGSDVMVKDRVEALKAMGVERVLEEIEHDRCIAVQERVGTALKQFSAAVGPAPSFGMDL
jgi:armadillo repeat-containing protein 8